MVYNPDLTAEKEIITGILVADLTSAQLDTIQKHFGEGAILCSPYPHEQLFIHDKREWASYSHADMKRAMPDDLEALIVIDSRSAEDGSAWYIDHFAEEDEVEDELAENTNTLFKVRMRLQDIVISYSNYKIANTDIREAMDEVDIPYPTPEHFDQQDIYKSGFRPIKDRYLTPTWVTATPDEIETTTDPDICHKFLPGCDVLYRLKTEVAAAHGLQVSWTTGSDTKDVTLPDGTKVKFPKGSKVLQLEYDAETAVPGYERPGGSL